MQVIQFKVLCHIYANFAAVENCVNTKILIGIIETNKTVLIPIYLRCKVNVENMDTEVNADSMGNKSSLGECNQNSQDIIVLDVGGRQFFVFKSIFSTWPNSRLSYILFIYIYI